MTRELGHELQAIEEVRDLILDNVEALSIQSLAIEEALGCVLREDLKAAEEIPPFDNSAMDGYAIQSADLASASREAPITLTMRGEIAAGSMPSGDVEPGTCIRIMTGAPMPSGADSVVPHELTERDDDRISFFAPIPAGKNIRRRGGDMKPGDLMLRSGTCFNSPRLAIAATLGAAEVSVTRPIRVAVLSPGDELVPVGSKPGPGQIRNSNAHSLAASLRETGVEAIDLGIVPDNPESLQAALDRGIAEGADAFVSSGGVSAGDYDYVHRVVMERGDPAWVFKVAMRPGKPLVFGKIEGRPFFGLPGNPASSIVSFEVFVRPALRKMRGEREVLASTFRVRFPFDHRYRSGRTFLLRTAIEPDTEHGGYRVRPPSSQDSSFLASMAENNALVILPSERDVIEAGQSCDALWLGSSRP